MNRDQKYELWGPILSPWRAGTAESTKSPLSGTKNSATDFRVPGGGPRKDFRRIWDQLVREGAPSGWESYNRRKKKFSMDAELFSVAVTGSVLERPRKY